MNKPIMLLVLLAGCAAEQPTRTTTAAAQPVVAADREDLCTQTFTRQRECTSDYIPALVDTRMRLDHPAGIAQASRDEVIATALEEWKDDSSDASIARMCASMTPSAEDSETARGCLAQADCQGFVACIMPVVEAHLR